MKTAKHSKGRSPVDDPADPERVEQDGVDTCRCGGPATEPDDADLVAGCLRGEAKSWEALVRRYQRLVFAIVRRMGMDEHMAADVFQTVFAHLLNHLPRIADPP